MYEYKRSTRVAELLREILSKLITQEMKDPRLGLITVTKVKLSDDLKHAKVFVSVLGNKKSQEATLEALINAKSYLKNELAHQTKLKNIPDLLFRYDDSAEYAQNIESILKKLKDD